MKELIAKGRLRPIRDITLDMPTLPKDGRALLARLVKGLARSDDRNTALWVPGAQVTGDLEIPKLHSLWHRNQKIGLIVCAGDMIVSGDLLNDDQGSASLQLVVTGNLKIRSWLRGGVSTFVGGDVVARGCIVGEYNDSLLFVGGDLIAPGGYVHRRKPYPDIPNIAPHQIAGKTKARVFDGTRDPISGSELKRVFHPDVLGFDAETDSKGFVFYRPRAMLQRCADGHSVWKN